jgi:hypothetical protein
VNRTSAKGNGLYKSKVSHKHKFHLKQSDNVIVGVKCYEEWGTDNLSLNSDCKRFRASQQGNVSSPTVNVFSIRFQNEILNVQLLKLLNSTGDSNICIVHNLHSLQNYSAI